MHPASVITVSTPPINSCPLGSSIAEVLLGSMTLSPTSKHLSKPGAVGGSNVPSS